MKKLIVSLLGLIALGISVQASAVILSLTPASQLATNGDTVFVDLEISGLGDFGPDSLGDFDVDVVFDDSVLSFSGYTLGPFLGAPFDSIDFSLGDLGGGFVNLAEVSLLEPDFATCVFCFGPFLDDIQPGSFTLATLEFSVDDLDPGSSTIVDIAGVFALGDGFGLPLPLDGTDSAEIRSPRIATPAPAVVALLGIGLLGFTAARRFRG